MQATNSPQFILIQCRGYKIIHGFDSGNREIEEVNPGAEWMPKLIAVSRIQSVTEKYIRMSYSHDRIIYWEYHGGLSQFSRTLRVPASEESEGPVVHCKL
ncbi:MAG: hypothetical protein AB7P04_13970 [Bacteriovoracia bacterium]